MSLDSPFLVYGLDVNLFFFRLVDKIFLKISEICFNQKGSL
jgi:hypothetical protein